MTFDAILVGGGLQNALVALAALQDRPNARLLLLERSDRLCGNHTWSFHEGDLSEQWRALLGPAIVREWAGYTVRFPSLTRRIGRRYASISSSALAALVSARVSPEQLRLRADVAEVGADFVVLTNGTRCSAPFVVDATGPRPAAEQGGPVQKFLGLELELSEPSPIDEPIVMDACVEQLDGFRFVYSLPLAKDRLLIEDTYYSDSPRLDAEVLRERVLAYAEQLGAKVRRVVRAEQGVLPLPLDWRTSWPVRSPFLAGYGGGWFHPTTGYSLPPAARFAEALAASWPHPDLERLDQLRAEHDVQARFFTLLNRLMFRALPPHHRWTALERFHRLPDHTIERFYALRTSRTDRARLLLGKPPSGIRLGRAALELAGLGAST